LFPGSPAADKPKIEEINLNGSDRRLLKISQERVLALNLEEMSVLRDYLKDKGVLKERKKVGLGGKMTDVELECLAQTWSEHCKHKIFNSLITYRDEKGRTQKNRFAV